MEKFILNTKYFILYTLIFLFPFFFLKTTQEYFVTNKLYFLGFGILLLLLISLIQFLFSKKIYWEKSPFDGPIILFLTSVAVSTFFTPNKIQSFLNLNFGAMMIIFLGILYFYISRSNGTMKQWNNGTIFLSVFLSFTTIILYFLLPGFTPVGSKLDLVILLGFFLIIQITYFLTKKQWNNVTMKQSILNFLFFTLNFLALFLAIRNLSLQLPSFRLSWFAVLEILKNPLTAIIGVGPDNFSTVFTKIKDFSYNQSPLWYINSFNISRSAFFQIITETGIFGLLSFCLLIFSAFKKKRFIFLFLYLIICLFIFPSSLIVWFLFFIVVSMISSDSIRLNPILSDLSDSIPIYLGIIIISFSLIGGTGYLLGRSYAGELFYKKSLDGIVKNDAKQAYENQRQAIILNPFIEKYRNNFAQINILVASNLAKKNPDEITSEDRQVITQAVQMAISEGKILVKLNPKRAQYWTNLGDIYMNIIPLAKDSDAWAVASYQRAIVLDPFNPLYQLNIGGVYFRIEKYKEAISFFEEAIKLKPDWSNAQYNLAWAYFRNKDYQKALFSMQNSINLINKSEFPKEWASVNRDFELFKNEYGKLNIYP